MNLPPPPLLRLATREASGGGMTTAGRLEPIRVDRCAPGRQPREAVIKKPGRPCLLRYSERLASGSRLPLVLSNGFFPYSAGAHLNTARMNARHMQSRVSGYLNQAATFRGSK